MNLIAWLIGISVAMCLSAAPVAAQQSCPTGYPLTTPDSDFADAGNGTVLHIPTGLVWKRCAEGQTWDGATCQGTIELYTWEQAFQRAAAVKAGTEGWNAGQADWRVPNVKELNSIVEYGCVFPSINLNQFPNTSYPYPAFWTSSPHTDEKRTDFILYSGEGRIYARCISFHEGIGFAFLRPESMGVRLVRGGDHFYDFDAATALNETLPVPTLSEWGGIVLAALVGMAAWLVRRRERRP